MAAHWEWQHTGNGNTKHIRQRTCAQRSSACSSLARPLLVLCIGQGQCRTSSAGHVPSFSICQKSKLARPFSIKPHPFFPFLSRTESGLRVTTHHTHQKNSATASQICKMVSKSVVKKRDRRQSAPRMALAVRMFVSSLRSIMDSLA